MNELYEAGLILRFSVRQQRPGRPLVEWALLTPHADEALRQLEVIAGELLAQQAREDSGQA